MIDLHNSLFSLLDLNIINRFLKVAHLDQKRFWMFNPIFHVFFFFSVVGSENSLYLWVHNVFLTFVIYGNVKFIHNRLNMGEETIKY